MILNISKALRIVTALSAFALLYPAAARAQTVNNGSAGIIPSQTDAIPEYDLSQGEETHPMIRLTPDKPQIVHLDSDARSVIVGNPAHLNAVLDTTRSLVLVPRDPGATHITVIGRDGKVVMERYVIVAGPAEKYIRVRRNCAPIGGANGAAGSGNANCAQTTVYFCPDMCHETKILKSALGQPAAPPAPLSSDSSSSQSSSSGESSSSPADTSGSGENEGSNSGAGTEQPQTSEPAIENSDTNDAR